MTIHRNTEQQIVSWWWGIQYSRLSGDPDSVEDGVNEMLDMLDSIESDPESLKRIAPNNASEKQLKLRLRRLRQALAGVSLQTIAEMETEALQGVRKVRPEAVSENVKHSVQRMAILARRLAEESEEVA